ncbi:MAG: AAA family ATPase [Prevotella sp.]|nr:AAA family ATPase [Prevotella sp.]
MAEKRKYGIGRQWFPDFKENGCVYVDKTEYVWKLAHHGGINYFLSRPRRFGKSLLVSTLHAYFEGRRELFEGLAIEQLETEWTPYPVIHLDLSNGKYYELARVHPIVNGLLSRMEKEWGVTMTGDPYAYGERLVEIIQAAYQQTGQKVVVLIDEYDAPMLDTVHKPDLQDQIRERIRDLFSPLKGQAPYLRFVFLTGISKFSQLSVFSELNNLTDLTFDTEYEGICGITEEELFTVLKPDLEWLTKAMSRWRQPGWGYDDCVREVKRMYDGYHFTVNMADIYNPWSLFYAFDKGMIDHYWFSTGTPSSLINLFKVKRFSMPDLEGIEANMKQFNAPTERISDPVPALFQSGYLTIKGYNPNTGRYKLGFPNEEVYQGFGYSLYQYYCEEYVGSENQMDIAYQHMRIKDITFEQFLEAVRKWYAGIPYSITSKNQNEQFYQSLFYSLMVGVGADVHAEEQTSDGRMDISLKMQDAIYIFEFKSLTPSPSPRGEGSICFQGGDAVSGLSTPLSPWRGAGGEAPFAADPRPVYAVGLNIDSQKRTISSYDITKL